MEITLNPCTKITVDAIGKPGQRVFYIQASSDLQIVTLIIEKIQLQSLAVSVLRFLDDLQKQYPDITIPSGKYNEEDQKITPPIDPFFRVGEIQLSYEIETDMICLNAKEIIMESNAGSPEDDLNSVNFWCSREQIKTMSNWGLNLIQQGRPICPLCQNPIDPSGHFCPKKNGHIKH
ncbi:MAG: hypothetical protein CVU46_08445 [Chloroflexi bacterium HGW-Chloroflexi-8]|nr:MAG: hypothetical protein CVU46_08445 [Chloroflexi bacterium HGW-Chloroflexi-8]